MKLPTGKVTRTYRRKLIEPIKDNILAYVNRFGMKIKDIKKAGHNESKQYIYYINYDSVVMNKEQSIKLEIGLRFNPILPISKRPVNHKFLHPFTREPLFNTGSINCFALKELVAEKMRATATRIPIAPRDFYDLGFLIRNGFNFKDKQLFLLFKNKLKEDGFNPELKKYLINMGRTEKEIEEINSRIEVELLDVLTVDERKIFNMEDTLNLINQTLKSINK